MIAALMGILYAADYARVRFGVRKPFGVVQVRRYYAVVQKSGKPEYYFLDPQNQTCVHSLFPHLGYLPCWYLSRHAREPIDM